MHRVKWRPRSELTRDWLVSHLPEEQCREPTYLSHYTAVPIPSAPPRKIVRCDSIAHCTMQLLSFAAATTVLRQGAPARGGTAMTTAAIGALAVPECCHTTRNSSIRARQMRHTLPAVGSAWWSVWSEPFASTRPRLKWRQCEHRSSGYQSAFRLYQIRWQQSIRAELKYPANTCQSRLNFHTPKDKDNKCHE